MKNYKDQDLRDEVKRYPCVVCGGVPSTPSHIKTWGSGGPDEPFNILPKCVLCHSAWEGNRINFLNYNPHLGYLLRAMGWEWIVVGSGKNERKILHHENLMGRL
jgi:hypothetical protein